MIQGYYTSGRIADMDVKAIHAFITQSYWAKGVPFETVTKGIQHSICCGVFTSASTQVGFARMVTDRATFGYLADVYIHENHRGKGLSRWLLTDLLAHPDLQGLRRIMLATSDASELYRKFGFEKLTTPDIFMEIWNRQVYE